MPSRNQERVRRDINRIKSTIDNHPDKKALKAWKPLADLHATAVNDSARTLMAARAKQNKEATERDTVSQQVLTWIQSWRPIVLTSVPGAATAIRAIPSDAPTPDDLANVVDDIAKLVDSAKGADGAPLGLLEGLP